MGEGRGADKKKGKEKRGKEEVFLTAFKINSMINQSNVFIIAQIIHIWEGCKLRVYPLKNSAIKVISLIEEKKKLLSFSWNNFYYF